MVRWACRAERFDCPLLRRVPHRDRARAQGPVLSGLADEAALGAAEPCSVVPDRRNVRAGDDGELGGGSGISHANAAGETDGGSAGVAETLGDGRPEGAVLEGAVLEGAVPKGAVREGAAGQASSPDGFAADSAGYGRGRPGRRGRRGLEAERGRVIDGGLLGLARRRLPVHVRPRRPTAARCSYGVGWQRGYAVRYGSVGGGRAAVAPCHGGPNRHWSVDVPARWCRGPARVPSDAASSGGAAMAGAGLAAVGFCGDGLGRYHDAARLRVLLVADQVIIGSP